MKLDPKIFIQLFKNISRVCWHKTIKFSEEDSIFYQQKADLETNEIIEKMNQKQFTLSI